jgi:ABC-type polysaccharide/polyol phosphate transport system ATPase subunit
MLKANRTGAADVAAGLRGWRTWTMLAWNDVHRRSGLGQFSLTLSIAAMIGGLCFVYSLLDEIICVGDQSFAARARERLLVLIDAASILVLATHDTNIITQLCSSAIWLSHGRVVDIGPPVEALERYAKNAAPA